MQVKAKGPEGKVVGFDGTKRRRGGEVFTWPAGLPLGTWVEAADPNDKATAAAIAKARAEVGARIEHAKAQQNAGLVNPAQLAALEKQLAELKSAQAEAAKASDAKDQRIADLEKQLAEAQQKKPQGGTGEGNTGKK